MLPSLTERDIEAGLRSFIEREFPIATPTFQPGGVSVVDSYIEKKGNFIQGPWLEIRRPFRTIAADMKTTLPHLSGKWGIASNWCKIHKKTYGIPKFSYGCFFEGTFGITPLRKLASMLR